MIFKKVLLTILFFILGFCMIAKAENNTQKADVVVIVDTSTSMKQPGMDPERTSLLVTKLLSDIVPGNLAVVRLLDLVHDKDVLPRHETNEMEACEENPSNQCKVVKPASDWIKDARTKQLGVFSRPFRGDENYKKKLKRHLEQRINNSLFFLAFSAAQGVFDQHSKQPKYASTPRTIIWLSDGRTEGESELKNVLNKIQDEGTAIEAIIFGNGDTRIAQEAGLDIRQTSNPAELMKAFAGAFRRIVKAPYEIDNRVSIEPRFQMKNNVEEAWIVVYGDKTLGEVELQKPNGSTIIADYAADSLNTAGAYKVAYLRNPQEGQWTVNVTAGGANVAYAVVQRSNLAPVLLEPKTTIAENKVLLVAGIQAGLDGTLINDPELIQDISLKAKFQGQTIILNDNGIQGDLKANDGRYTSEVIFRGSGNIPVQLHLTSSMVERVVNANVSVSGSFQYTGEPLEVDLGILKINQESCRPLEFQAKHQGSVPFSLKLLKTTPSGHNLEIRFSNGSSLVPEGKEVFIKSTDTIQVCLKTDNDVPSSTANGEPWLNLHVANSSTPEHEIIINLKWIVKGLSFWERWFWVILLIVGILILMIIIAGFILPHRFPARLALVFVPDRDELDEQSPQPLKQWKGVGSGFYRNARAFLHADFRISGKSQGALVGLSAEKNKIVITGTNLFRENLDGDWESIETLGQRSRPGDVYRIGENGPYFRIATR